MPDTEMLGDVSAFNLEYRDGGDDAWYSVRVVLCEGNVNSERSLTVKFQGFTEASDLRYTVAQFQTVAEVDEFVKRFRPMSEQLQDSQCRIVTEGLRVCAALSFGNDDLRYFDAVVEAVNQEAHVLTNGEEECMCTFILSWLHGPSFGNLTTSGVGSICSIQADAQVDPDIYSFSKLAKQSIETSTQRLIATEPNGSGVKWKTEGRASKYNEQCDSDEDLGGNDVLQSDGLHVVLIDNLEADLSPTTIRQFIYENTSIYPEAYVFPSRSSVPYASGAIFLESESKLEKIFDFLTNPKHIIISGKGRPWIITEKMVRHKTYRSAARILALEYQGELWKSKLNRELEVVPSGTEAFQRAKQLRELFMEFLDHENRMRKRLALEETRILQSSQ